MYFEDKKLTPEAVDNLFQASITTVQPYTLMLSPVYVYMKRNEKFVSVKAPLDFFTPEELEKLKIYEVFHFPKFVKNSVRYQTAARLVQSLFKNPFGKARELEYVSYEYSDEIVKMVGKLWGKEMKIEPFFMAIFTHELCETFKPELMLWARETNVVNHDHGLLLSGVFVFLAVHLGYYNLEQLNTYRDEIYSRTVQGETWESPKNEMEIMVSELNRLMQIKKTIEPHDFEDLNLEWAWRLRGRLKRIANKIAKRAEAAPSIYGPEGFAG